MKVKILGICGSPRHGNTEIAVKEALAGAAGLPEVETEFYSIVGKKLNPCLGDVRCGTAAATPENPCPAWGPDDDIVKLVKKMQEFDGFVVGTPIYIGTVTAQLKMIIDRSIMMTEAGPLGPLGLRNKVLGVVVTSGDRNGGHDLAIVDIWRWAILADMVVTGVGPERVDGVNYWGGVAIQAYTYNHPDGGKTFWWQEVNSVEERTAVKYDIQGLAQCKNTGRRVAELAKVLKAGFDTVPRQELYWPRGKAGGLEGTVWVSRK